MTTAVREAERPLIPNSDLDHGAFPRVDAESGRLRGSRCTGCGQVVFPHALACYRCRGLELEAVDLPDEGVLATFTTVHVSSSREVPYTVGYVDLPGDIRILAPIRPVPSDLACDVRVRRVTDADGWAFATITEENSDV